MAAEFAPVAQDHLSNIPYAFAVHKDPPGADRCFQGHLIVFETDDIAIFRQKNIIAVHAHIQGDLCMFDEMPVFPMDRDEKARFYKP